MFVVNNIGFADNSQIGRVRRHRQCNGVVQLETWFFHFGNPSMPETSTHRNSSAECFIACISFNCFVWIEFEDENESYF